MRFGSHGLIFFITEVPAGTPLKYLQSFLWELVSEIIRTNKEITKERTYYTRSVTTQRILVTDPPFFYIIRWDLLFAFLYCIFPICLSCNFAPYFFEHGYNLISIVVENYVPSLIIFWRHRCNFFSWGFRLLLMYLWMV